MAANERRALGRGLGSLIPDRDPDVSRETISKSEGKERPSDLFFSGGSGRDSGQRRSHSLSADLLKPAPRSKRGSSSASASKASSKKAKTSSKSSTKRDKEAKPPTPAQSGAKAPELDVETATDNAAVTERVNGSSPAPTKRPLFADIIEGENASGDSGTHVGTHEPASEQALVGQADLSAGDTSLSAKVLANEAKDVKPNVADGTSGSDEVELLPVPGARFAEIDVNLVVPNPKQPREVFDEFDLQELADSIREIGVLQPVVVRPVDGSDERFVEIVAQSLEEGVEVLPAYELIMGERRLRASKLAGLNVIPAIVRDTEDDDLLRDALLENLHRSQLNPIEEANAYQQLMSDFGYTQQELSDRIKRSRPQIANALRLLKLPPSVQRKLAAGVISAGHARALLGLPNASQMEVLCERIIAEGLSVRTIEEIVALGEVSEAIASKKVAKRMPKPLSENASAVVDRLTDLFDTRVTVFEGKRKGRITIEYAGTP